MARGVQDKQGINDPRFVPSVWRSVFFLAMSLASFSAKLLHLHSYADAHGLSSAVTSLSLL